MLPILVLIAFTVTDVQAQTPACDKLTGRPKVVAIEVMRSQHPYDCCDDTIARCIETRRDCGLAVRLADHACRMAAAGQDAAAISRSLEKRATSMMRPGKVLATELSRSQIAGKAGARVVLVAYLCARCPMCSKLIPAVHREVTTGRLSGKAAFHFKLFPVKGHEGAAEANLAVAAAGSLGKGWEYLLALYGRFDSFTQDMLPALAGDVGLDRTAFAAASASPGVREELVESKKEGLRNGVTSTPAFVINGRRYVGDMDIETLVDCLEEEAEAVRSSVSQ